MPRNRAVQVELFTAGILYLLRVSYRVPVLEYRRTPDVRCDELCKWQMTTDHRNIPVLLQIGVTEFIDGVRIFTGNTQIVVSTHVQ